MTKVFTPTDSRARIADWMELQALITSRKVTSAQLIRSVNIIDDPVRDAEDEDRLGDVEYEDDVRGDRGILNTVDENLSLRVFDEIEYRAEVLGESYPFEIGVAGQNWSISPRIGPAGSATGGLAHSFYLTSLLIAAVRYEYLDIKQGHRLAGSMPEFMQVMSVLVAAEYIGGEVYWMGWPRPDDTGKFREALRTFIARISVGRLISENPAYDPVTAKDGSVDLIAWRSFKDGKAGKAVLYGQVASGKNWRSKPLSGTIDPHFMGWFQNGPTKERMFSMFIPFMQHEDCKPTRNQAYGDLQTASAEKDERSMGIIFDRLRITELAALVSEKLADISLTSGIDFQSYVTRIDSWCKEVVLEVC